MDEHVDPSSDGPLTLKFRGVDDETTSEEENEDEEQTDITTHAADVVGTSSTTDKNHLTVNTSTGKRMILSLCIESSCSM